jgi:hypothetical protein
MFFGIFLTKDVMDLFIFEIIKFLGRHDININIVGMLLNYINYNDGVQNYYLIINLLK